MVPPFRLNRANTDSEHTRINVNPLDWICEKLIPYNGKPVGSGC